MIDSFFFYFNDKRYRPFQGTLPSNLSIKMTNGDIVSYLGEPNIKAGGKLSNITLTYNKLGFEVEFYSKVWEAADAPIAHVCFFLPEKKIEIICAVCRKSTSSRCS